MIARETRLNPLIGQEIPPRSVHHADGPALVTVGGMVGCYVTVKPTKFHSGNDAEKLGLWLTPQEARDLAYQLRVVAERVDAVLTPGRYR